jgi:cytochrome c biogenesis factor
MLTIWIGYAVKMDYEIFLLISAAILFFADLALLSTSKKDSKRKNVIGFVAAVFGFGLIAATYTLLVQALASNNFQVIGVYSYSSSGASLLSKVYASWAGAGGSMLFLTFLLSIVYFALRVLALWKPDKFNTSACQVFAFALLIFIAVTLVRNPFERFTDVPVEGMGLNPSLQSFWMAIHPPIVFSAYTFVVLAYALTLASIKSGKELDSSRLFKSSTYMAWILLTLGIALGGVWAYEVLGWGGYWAWDPVETASLLPWLLLTAYFIVKAMPKNKQSLTREFMVMVTFASLVFLSALTRGGFTTSVHSYAASVMGPILLAFALVMIGYFFYLKSKKRMPLFKLEVDKSSLTSRSYSVGFWSLILISVICLVGLAFANFAYSYWTFPFVLIFVASLMGFSLGEKTHYARLLMVVMVALGVGVAVTVVGFPAVNMLTILTIPLLFVAFSVLLHGVVKSVRHKSLYLLGQCFLSLAIVVLLFGVFLSAGAKIAVTVDNVKANTAVEALHFSVQLSHLTSSRSSTEIYSEQTGIIAPEFSTITADVTVQRSGRSYVGTLVASLYPNYPGLVLRPLIIATETGDIYLHFEPTNPLYSALVSTYSGIDTVPEEVSVTVQNSPMIYLVWAGVALMLVGMSIQFAGDLMRQKQESKN